jgi:hypothetical protein
MGMFDWIEFEGRKYQTKDTPRQLLDEYRIDDRGQLWVEEYDAEWQEDADSMFGGYLRQFNQRWTECADFTGSIRFYREDQERGGHREDAWIEWLAEFELGRMTDLKMLEGDRFLTWYQEAIEKRGLE